MQPVWDAEKAAAAAKANRENMASVFNQKSGRFWSQKLSCDISYNDPFTDLPGKGDRNPNPRGLLSLFFIKAVANL